jgi:hypothetical protein
LNAFSFQPLTNGLCTAREAPVIKMESFHDNDLLDLFRGIVAHDILSLSGENEDDLSVECIWTGISTGSSPPRMLKQVLLLSRNEDPSSLALPSISVPVLSCTDR